MSYRSASSHLPHTEQSRATWRLASSRARSFAVGNRTTESGTGGAVRKDRSGPTSFSRHHFGECRSRAMAIVPIVSKRFARRSTSGFPGCASIQPPIVVACQHSRTRTQWMCRSAVSVTGQAPLHVAVDAHREPLRFDTCHVGVIDANAHAEQGSAIPRVSG